tara:strand:- start:2094 stop:5357 length:3264 start_codon:yes stop_codon:yes gene_type:complete
MALFSQDKIFIEKDQYVAVNKVFRIIKGQNSYAFVFPTSMFKDTPKIQLTKGEIELGKLLNQILIPNNLNFELSNDKTITIKKNHLKISLDDNAAVTQEIKIKGVVKTQSGQPLPGASILEKGTVNGSQSDFNGDFTIDVTNQNAILVVSYLGFTTQELTVGDKTNFTIILMEDTENLLDEIVVTGVAIGTSTKKLGFTVSKVSGASLEEVPAVNASNTLRGKVAGINIFQSQGDGSASVSLRGAKSIFGNTSPLILIDGIITNQGLGTINTSDIKTIEIIKGAAASSLYGSRAAGGVIQIITKKGKRGAENMTVSYRSEVGFNDLERKYPVAQKHNYLTNSDGSIILNVSGQAQADPDGLFDGDYNTLGFPTFDLFKRGLTNGTYKDNSVSVSGGGEKYNFYLAAQMQDKGGIVAVIDSDKSNTLRANFDLYPTEKLSIGVRTSYSHNDLNSISRSNRNSFWGSFLTFAPFIDVLEKDDDGDYKLEPSGIFIQNIGSVNPYYGYKKIIRENKNDRYVGGLKLDYKISDKLIAKLAGSMDKYYSSNLTYHPVGFKTTAPDPNLNNGQIVVGDSRSTFSTASMLLNYNTEITEDLKANFTAKYLIEHQTNFSQSMAGSDLTTGGVYDISVSSEDRRRVSSYRSERNAQNVFVAADLDFKDKLIFSGLVRRDGSSMFGANERWQTYYRASLAYRLTQDITIDNIQELKFRASYGTAGRRPGFSYQYETANVGSGGSISFDQTGNPNLKPSENKEFEVGFDVDFLDRFHLTSSYSNSVIKNDFINRNLPSSTSLFSRQWQNLGAVEAKTVELYLNGKVIENDKFSWNFGLAFDTSKSTITDLGDILPFTNGIYRIENQKEVGTMYGNWAFKSLSEIEFDANGEPTNIHTAIPAGTTKADLVVNNLGFVVVKSTVGTADESVLMAKDDKGNLDIRKIGKTTPDFKLGLSNTIKFGNGIGLYILMDYKHGGDTYNYTTQDLLFNDRSNLQVLASEAGHHSNYSGGSSTFYNTHAYSNAFVENSTYLKLREMAISYSLDKSALGKTFKDVKLALVGRNLLTFTNYTGWNPETFIEEYSFPLYRTFSLSLSLKF